TAAAVAATGLAAGFASAPALCTADGALIAPAGHTAAARFAARPVAHRAAWLAVHSAARTDVVVAGEALVAAGARSRAARLPRSAARGTFVGFVAHQRSGAAVAGTTAHGRTLTAGFTGVSAFGLAEPVGTAHANSAVLARGTRARGAAAFLVAATGDAGAAV